MLGVGWPAEIGDAAVVAHQREPLRLALTSRLRREDPNSQVGADKQAESYAAVEEPLRSLESFLAYVEADISPGPAIGSHVLADLRLELAADFLG